MTVLPTVDPRTTPKQLISEKHHDRRPSGLADHLRSIQLVCLPVRAARPPLAYGESVWPAVQTGTPSKYEVTKILL